MLPTTFLVLTLLCNFYAFDPVSAWSVCQNTCGGIPVMYPFGTGRGCGSPMFQYYINCTAGRLRLFTSTGVYLVKSIDYSNDILIIQDPHMSTCSSIQHTSRGFGLPLGAPFSIMSFNTFILLGCSSGSSVHNALSSVCDPAGTQICQSLYGCTSVTQIGIPINGPTSSCCVYSNSQITLNPPFEINLQLLQCQSYSDVYSFGPEYSYGGGTPTTNYQDPTSWSYGIALKYFYDQSAYTASCKACQDSNGVCGFSTDGFVCVCSGGVNTTTHCFGPSYVSHTGSLYLHQSIMTGGLSILWVFLVCFFE